MTITEFLEARITDEEVDAARDLADMRRSEVGIQFDCDTQKRFTPARVLAECAAKRIVVNEHEPVDYSGIGMESPNACQRCGVDTGMGDWEWLSNSFPCYTLKAVAAVYKDHPGYQQEWAL